jgi:hypothetical protein
MHREDDAAALAQRHDLGAALHAGPLLGQHELAAGEVRLRLRQQDRHLQRKSQLAIEVLVQAVEVSRTVLQQQRRGPDLTGGVTLVEKIGVTQRIAASSPSRSFHLLAIGARLS